MWVVVPLARERRRSCLGQSDVALTRRPRSFNEALTGRSGVVIHRGVSERARHTDTRENIPRHTARENTRTLPLRLSLVACARALVVCL